MTDFTKWRREADGEAGDTNADGDTAEFLCRERYPRLKMSDRDQYLPLTPNLVRSLNDKLYEKRKVAALEIEKWVFTNVPLAVYLK